MFFETLCGVWLFYHQVRGADFYGIIMNENGTMTKRVTLLMLIVVIALARFVVAENSAEEFHTDMTLPLQLMRMTEHKPKR